MTTDPSREAADALTTTLNESFAAAAPELCQDGWTFEAVTTRFLMGKHLPVAGFRKGDTSLCFIVAPTDPAERVFKRGPRFDVTYFSEDVPDEEQSQIYRRDRPQIERVAAWVCKQS